MELQNRAIKMSATIIERLTLDLNQNEFFIKRDDLIPFSFGGNKARKAVNFFQDILQNNYNVVVSYGSAASNHCRIVANMASKYKIPCYIVSPAENYEKTSNSKMVELFGAKIIKARVDKIKETIDNLIDELSKENRPYFIQGGGHGNLGTQAYVDAYDEIALFEKQKQIKFDYIFHASGTGTTQAGLVCGDLLNNGAHKIVGISIARTNPRGKNVVEESVRDYLKSIGCNKAIPQIIFDDSYILGGYGKYNDEVVSVIKEALLNDGIALNTTYTGKALWGMKQYILKNSIKNKKILFIHTGGTPLFFDNLGENL